MLKKFSIEGSQRRVGKNLEARKAGNFPARFSWLPGFQIRLFQDALRPPPVAVLACITAAIAADEWRLPDEKPAFKSAPGADIAQANCIMCHSHEYISMQPPLTRDQWKAPVAKMQQKYGAPIAPEAVDALLDYLAQAYGKTAK